MDNQHREIKGYRELSAEEIALMNEVKGKGVELGELVEKLRAQSGTDKRWVSIGATDLQTGLMALTRAIAKPTFFALSLLVLSGCGLNLQHTQVEEPPVGQYKKVHHTITFDTEPQCVASCNPSVKSW